MNIVALLLHKLDIRKKPEILEEKLARGEIEIDRPAKTQKGGKLRC